MAKKKTDLKYYEAIGRRKAATARVRLYILSKEVEISVKDKKIKKGEIVVNGEPVDSYFPGEVNKQKYLFPLNLTKTKNRFAISVKVRGGGKNGQLEAMILGLSRALQGVDGGLRPALKKAGLLTRDARVKESRKVGTGGKARRQKQSPKR